ncbi:hypothetical protein RB597_001076 [Gaeumannomyces tritici]
MASSTPAPNFSGETFKAGSATLTPTVTQASTVDAFSYSPLTHPGNIRLLRLLPNHNRGAPIRCQLLEYPLHELGQAIHLYEGLSYVWGSDQNKQPIYIQSTDQNATLSPSANNDRSLLVTVNLREALPYLRNPFIERILWIDAVCINQQDDDEKGQQVQMMAKIYASASRVVVWLGTAADDSDRALEALRETADSSDRPRHRDGDVAAVVVEAGGARDASPTIDEPNQHAILSLLRRPWFERVWVLQEVAAARYILIKCGSCAVDGSTFCSGLQASKATLYDKHPDLQHLIPSIISLITSASTRPQFETRLPQNSPSLFSLSILPLGNLVDMFHTRKATNPLDRVYALLGMSSDGPESLSVDYRLPWGEVFRNLIQFSLSNQTMVDTWNDRLSAVIRGKGQILGKICEVSSRGDA